MYRTNDILQWLMTIISVFVIFYLMILFLPIILAVVGGYLLYVWLKVRRVKQQLQESSYMFETEQEMTHEHKIIDAEFEVLDEKNHQ
ncbi:MAG: hypothetical protein IJ660_03280 [Alphaproteobacteria bacterium]|nr:hypothetical protein [Alphaproteobacteria bacterium]